MQFGLSKEGGKVVDHPVHYSIIWLNNEGIRLSNTHHIIINFISLERAHVVQFNNNYNLGRFVKKIIFYFKDLLLILLLRKENRKNFTLRTSRVVRQKKD